MVCVTVVIFGSRLPAHPFPASCQILAQPFALTRTLLFEKKEESAFSFACSLCLSLLFAYFTGRLNLIA